MMHKTILFGSLFTSMLLLLIPSISAMQASLSEQSVSTLFPEIDLDSLIQAEDDDPAEPLLITTILILLIRFIRGLLKSAMGVLKLVRIFGWVFKIGLLLIILNRRANNSAALI